MSASKWVLSRLRSRGFQCGAFSIALATASAGVSAGAETAATTSSAASTNVADSATLEEVIVTARKRSEDLQKTPVSETVLSAADASLLNVKSFQDLSGLVPDLDVAPQSSGGLNLAIRGLGQDSNRVNQDVKTGLYVNDMYVSRQEGNSLSFFDVDSLQVLKGPQGTLFGKNTTGGAILLTTALPTSDPGGYIQVRTGNYDRVDTEGAMNLPINDQLMARVSFRTDSAAGFISHVDDTGKSDNINDKSIRGQIRWQPTDKLTVDFLGEYNVSNTDGITSIVTACTNNNYFTGNYNALHTQSYCSLYPILSGNRVYGGATLAVPTDSIQTPIATGGDYSANGVTPLGHPGPFNNTEVITANLRINYQISDGLTFKSVTAERRSQFAFYNPTENAPDDIYAEYDSSGTTQLTEEDNVTGTAFDGRLNYVGGLYYYLQRTSFLEDTGPDWADPTGFVYLARNDYTSYAAYTQASYKITPPLEITVGARYTLDRKDAGSLVNLQTNYNAPCATFVDAFTAGIAACNTNITGTGRKQWDAFSPRLQLSYQFTPDFYSYLSVARGYNAGGFNQQIEVPVGGHLLAYAPEELTDYEVGIKTEWLDKTLRFNLTAFRQYYSDIQTNVVVVYNGVAFGATETGASAIEQGLEMDAEYAPTRDLRFTANGSLLRQWYTRIDPGVTSFTLQTPPGQAPNYTYSFSAADTLHLDGGHLLTPSVNWRYTGAVPSCIPTGSCNLPAYGLLGSRIDFKVSESSPWTVSLWGTNLLNHTVQLAAENESLFGVTYYTPGRPREFGAEFRRTF